MVRNNTLASKNTFSCWCCPIRLVTYLLGKIQHWRLWTRVVHVSGQLGDILDHGTEVVHQCPHRLLHHVADVLCPQMHLLRQLFVARDSNYLLNPLHVVSALHNANIKDRHCWQWVSLFSPHSTRVLLLFLSTSPFGSLLQSCHQGSAHRYSVDRWVWSNFHLWCLALRGMECTSVFSLTTY